MKSTVVVPTFNERENLPKLADLVLQYDVDLLVVDDGSPDGTGAVAEELATRYPGRVHVRHRSGPRGLGRSYVEGMKHALAMGADVICQMDADLSHGPEYLPQLIGATREYDLVIGSRYVNGISVVNWPLRRLILSTAANAYVRAITRLPVRDCTAGYRAWRRTTLERVPLDRISSEGYSFQVEMLFHAAGAGCSILEVPIIFVERRQGQSKLSNRVMLESLVCPWRLMLRRLSANR
jgi:dolichol-phosphate mannosyltransferase